jgi:hypothetical protein
VNIGAPWPTLEAAEARVQEIQTKLHRWARDDPHRRFDDLYNLVGDPAFLLVAWDRVRCNKGARTAGVDGQTAYYIQAVRGLEGFLAELRDDLKARIFQPLPVRQRAILWVPVIRFASCGLPVLMDQSTKSIPPHNPASRQDSSRFAGPQRRHPSQATMRAVHVS